jgi:protocatechuate 3,4-dioxygenase beta subunit
MTRFAAVAVWVAAVTSSVYAQNPPVVIHGRVVADETGAPIPHARVIVYDNATARGPLFTDADGSFAWEPLAAGRRRIVVSKAGYASVDITPPEPEIRDGLNLRLRRSGAISGRVVDARGDPVVNAGVAALDIRGPGDVQRNKTAVTDDRGEYRLGGLVEGRYVVRVSISVQADARIVFFPSATTPDLAQQLTIAPGDDKTGIDFAVDVPQALSAVVTTAPLVILNNGKLQPPLIPPPPRDDALGNAAIRGEVRARSGATVAGATVLLIALDDPPRSRTAISEDDGRFTFENLVSGRFRLSALKAGYIASDGGKREVDAGLRIELNAGEVRTRADLTLSRPSVVTGHVYDEFGDPLEGASVGVLQIGYEAGRRYLARVQDRWTDDRGEFRVFNIPAGRYAIGATAGRVTQFQPTGEVPGYALTYFPGTIDPRDAQLMSVGPSSEIGDVNITLSRTSTITISGQALGATGSPMSGGFTLSTSYRSGDIWTPAEGAVRGPDGQFEFPHVSPGDYVIQADRGRVNPSTEGDFIAQYVTVTGSDVTNLVMRATPGSTISGRVTFDGTSATPPRGFAIVPVSADFDLAPRQNGSIARAEVKPDLTFEIHGVHGPRRLQLGERTPGEWVLKSVFANGVDVTDQPLPFGAPQQSIADVEVVLTNRLTELDGTVTRTQGPAGESTVLMFPMDRARWYPGSRFFYRGRSTAAGIFAIRGLPPGEYYVAALPNSSLPTDGDEAWQDPQLLESLTGRSGRAVLNEGQKLSMDVRLITP